MRLGLRDLDFKSYEGGSLLSFNDSSTLPCGTIELPVSFGEGEDWKTMNMHFLVIPYESVYNDILGRSFLTKFDTVNSLIHLKMKYHNDSWKSVGISVGLPRARLIHKGILKNLIAIFITYERIVKNYNKDRPRRPRRRNVAKRQTRPIDKSQSENLKGGFQ